MHVSDHYTSDPKSSFAAAVAEGKEEDDPPEVFLYKERATDHGELPELSVSGCSDARLGIRETSELEPSTASVGSASTSAARSFSSNCTSCCLRIYRLQDSQGCVEKGGERWKRASVRRWRAPCAAAGTRRRSR